MKRFDLWIIAGTLPQSWRTRRWSDFPQAV